MIDDKIIQGFMKEFDALHKEQKISLSGARFVVIDGTKMNIDEFLKYKIAQL